MADHSKRSSSRPNSPRAGAKKTPPVGQVRIIAGRWRGRKLPVIESDGLRPTGDRVRETLFNWLQMSVPGSRVLDLYAGTGALGLEAASRGASSVTLVESSLPVAAQLRQTLSGLEGGSEITLCATSAEQFLETTPAPFDIVFVDPPFDLQLHESILEKLAPEFLATGALIYLELPTRDAGLLEKLPTFLSTIKEKRFGDVTVFLLRVQDAR